MNMAGTNVDIIGHMEKKSAGRQKRRRMRQLVGAILDAADAYYSGDGPVMGDPDYDKLRDELKELERETGVVFPWISSTST